MHRPDFTPYSPAHALVGARLILVVQGGLLVGRVIADRVGCLAFDLLCYGLCWTHRHRTALSLGTGAFFMYTGSRKGRAGTDASAFALVMWWATGESRDASDETN